MNWWVSQPGEWSCSVVWWYGGRYFCICCQMAAGWTDCGMWVLSFSISLHWCHWCSVDGGSNVLVVLISHWRTFLSWGMYKLCIFVMFPIRMLFIAPLKKMTRISLLNLASVSVGSRAFSYHWMLPHYVSSLVKSILLYNPQSQIPIRILQLVQHQHPLSFEPPPPKKKPLTGNKQRKPLGRATLSNPVS